MTTWVEQQNLNASENARKVNPPAAPWYESRANLSALISWLLEQPHYEEDLTARECLAILRHPEEWQEAWDEFSRKEALCVARASPMFAGEDP